MHLKFENTGNFVSERVVNAPSRNYRDDFRLDSLRRQMAAYTTLLEIRYGIMGLGDIVTEEDGNYYFNVVKGPYYTEFHESINKELVWCTDLNAPDYIASLAEWQEMLKGGKIKKDVLDRINSNDLTEQHFGDFKIVLTTFVVAATLHNDFYMCPNFEV